MYACVFFCMPKVNKKSKLKFVGVRMTADTYSRVLEVSSEQDVPNISGTVRDLVLEALAARKKKKIS